MSVALQLALALAGMAVLAGTAWVAGSLLLSRSGPRGPADGALAVALGLAVLAQLGFVLGLLGLLRWWAVLALVVGIHLAGRVELRRLVSVARNVGGPPRAAWGAALTVAVALAAILLALYPPTAFDETLYHLPMARSFARSGALPFLPDLRFPAFPALGEVLFAELWLWGGELSTHAVSVVATLATAGLLLGWARESARPEAGWVAAALHVGSPLAIYLAGTCYVEPLLALWATGALVAVARFRHDGSPAARNAAALLAGCAAATKYHGLLVLAFVAVEILWESRRRDRTDAALFCLWAVAAALPCYARIWLLAGNPLFPFFSEIFGSSPWDADSFLGSQGAAHWREAATVFWDAVFRRERLGGLPPATPALPFLLPLVLWRLAARLPHLGRRPAWFALALVAASPVHGHYLAIALPAFALAGGEAVATLADRLRVGDRRRRLAVLATALVLPGVLYAASWVWRFGPPPWTRASRDAYLEERLPLYGTVASLRELAPRAAVYGLFAENLRYHHEGRWLGDHNGPGSFARVLAMGDDAGALARVLRDLGADVLVVPEPQALRLAPLETTGPHLVLVRSDGRGRVYRLAPP